jgi:hypothetical protein
MALGSTQPLTEISTRKLPGEKSGRRVGLTTLLPSMSRMSENVGTSTSRNPKGLHGLYEDISLTFLYHRPGIRIAYMHTYKAYRGRETGTHLAVRLSTYLSTALQPFGLSPFFSLLIHTQLVGPLGRKISPSQNSYLRTEHIYRINARRYQCLGWDSNPRSQRSSERRQFMP